MQLGLSQPSSAAASQSEHRHTLLSPQLSLACSWLAVSLLDLPDKQRNCRIHLPAVGQFCSKSLPCLQLHLDMSTCHSN